MSNSNRDSDYDIIKDIAFQQSYKHWAKELYGGLNDVVSEVDVWMEVAKLPPYSTTGLSRMSSTTSDPSIKDMYDSIKTMKALGNDRGLAGPLEVLGMPIVEMPKFTKKVVRYRLPDGGLVKPDDVRIETRFVTYGPEDIEHLLFLGWISKECVDVDDDYQRGYVVNYSHGPVGYMPKAMITAVSCS